MGVWQEAKQEVERRQVNYEATQAARQRYPAQPDFSGAEILDTARDKFMTRYAYLSRRDADKVTLWAQHTHFKREGVLVFDATPRLLILSKKPASGKTTLLEELNLVCTNTQGLDINPTQYGLQYSLEREHATILLDEGDVSSIAKGTLAILNAGYTPSGKVLNGSKSAPTRVPCFGPVAIAGLDKMESDGRSRELGAFFTRCIRIYMEPGPHERWGKKAVEQGQIVNKAMAWWAASVFDEVADAEPTYPEGMDYRLAQIWDPLFRIADAAGGEWPDVARSIAQDDSLFPDGFLELMAS